MTYDLCRSRSLCFLLDAFAPSETRVLSLCFTSKVKEGLSFFMEDVFTSSEDKTSLEILLFLMEDVFTSPEDTTRDELASISEI